MEKGSKSVFGSYAPALLLFKKKSKIKVAESYPSNDFS
jgi:hypothetical protein